MSRKENYCFTLNNYTDSDIERLATLPCRFLIYGKELAPETGTPHLQGYVVFESAKTFSAATKCLPGCHVSVANGSADDNIRYCSKAGDVTERGRRPMSQESKGQTEKKRWREIVALAEDGDWDALKEKHPQVYATQLAKLEHVHNKRPRILEALDHTDIPHSWFYGAPGTGKSLEARKLAPEAYIKNPNTKWWDGYDGQDDVIIDDFDKYQVSQGGDMKRWLDIYPFQAETKGSQVMIRPKRIIVTSNYRPEEIWEDSLTHDAILRRVKTVHFKKFL